MNAAVWGANTGAGLGIGYRGGNRHTPVRPTPLIAALGGIDKIVTSYQNMYALYEGRVAYSGGNVAGQSAQGFDSPYICAPVVMKIDRPVLDLAASGASWVALLDDQQLVTCGGNPFGQLGNDSQTGAPGSEGTGSNMPVHLETPPIKAIVHGGGNVGAITNDGEVLIWGEGKHGQLGQGTKSSMVGHPILVPGLSDVVQFDVGGESSIGSHCLVLFGDGTVWGWGMGSHGEIGRELADALSPRPIPGLTGIKAVSAGVSHSLFLTSDGRVLGLGSDRYGQLGKEPTVIGEKVISLVEMPLPEPAIAISAGYGFSMVLLASGQVMVCGWNQHFTLGETADAYRAEPTKLPLEGVEQICAGEECAACTLTGEVDEPLVSAEWGPGQVTVRWSAQEGKTVRFAIRPQPDLWKEREEWNLEKLLIAALGGSEAEGGEHTATGLEAGKTYEWYVQNSAIGACTGEGAPA